MIEIDQEFLSNLDEQISKRDMKLIRSESKIDQTAKLAMLATNFASFHESNEDPEIYDIFCFEIKPKSGVTEYVPSKAHKYIVQNND